MEGILFCFKREKFRQRDFSEVIYVNVSCL